MKELEDFVIDKVTLEKLELRIRQDLDAQLLAGFLTDVRVVEDYTRQWAVEIRRHIYGKQLDQVEVRHPATWWDATKERWFPRWALRRWPAAYACHTMLATAYWPSITALCAPHRPVLTLYLGRVTDRGER